MIGVNKLSFIRQQLIRALAATGDDPIRWLEERMSAPARKETSQSGESEVMKALRRILSASDSPRRARRRAR